jgi:protein gp37
MALEARPGLSNRAIAEQVGVDHKTIGRIRVICGISPDETRTVTRNGTTYEMNVGGIGQDTDRNGIEDNPSLAVEPALEPLPGQSDIPFTLESPPAAIVAEVGPKLRATFNQTTDLVDWARWTWNPVTGCKHDCIYCYARDIANRFYAEKFEPTYRPERLEAPRNTRLPGDAQAAETIIERTAWKNVFVCSMADLFGRWVPDEWIDGVFDSCRKSPEWNYLFLTKFPLRYEKLDFPETAWVGTSVDEQKRVANAEKAFSRITAPVKWLSVEPMRERLQFSRLDLFDWVVIGGQSRSSQAPEFHPEPWWVIDLAAEAKAAGCKVYLKPNTFVGAGWQIKEYPYQ